MWTKRQIVEEAYAEMAMAGYIFDSTPEALQRAGRRLDMMMAGWDARGIQVGYALAVSPDDLDLDADAGIPLNALEAVVTNLALRLCAGVGKVPHPSTKDKAEEGLSTLMAAAAMPAEQQLRVGLPLGAGNKGSTTNGRIYVTNPDTGPLTVGDGGDLEFDEP